MCMTNFMIRSMPAGDADPGARAVRHTVADSLYPCRKCLRNAQIGDPLLLLPYNPFTVESPCAGDGPIFIHAEGCQAALPGPGEVCEQVLGRLLSVRGFDDDAMLLSSEVVAGEQLAERAGQLLDEGSAFLHVHFAGAGCFAFRVDPV